MFMALPGSYDLAIVAWSGSCVGARCCERGDPVDQSPGIAGAVISRYPATELYAHKR